MVTSTVFSSEDFIKTFDIIDFDSLHSVGLFCKNHEDSSENLSEVEYSDILQNLFSNYVTKTFQSQISEEPLHLFEHLLLTRNLMALVKQALHLLTQPSQVTFFILSSS